MTQTRVLATISSLQIKEITGETKNGPYRMYAVEKSVKDKEGAWKKESIILKPAEMPAIAALCEMAFNVLCKEAADARNLSKQEGGADY